MKKRKEEKMIKMKKSSAREVYARAFFMYRFCGWFFLFSFMILTPEAIVFCISMRILLYKYKDFSVFCIIMYEVLCV